MLKTLICACAIAGAAGLAACEKAGEAVDSTISVKRDNQTDVLSDAVDGDGSTKPN